MKILKKIVVYFMIIVSSTTALADDNGVLVKTRIVMNIPSSVKLKVVEDKIKQLVDERTDKYNEYRGIMPDEVPVTPAEAKDIQSAATLNFDDALYAVRAYTHSSFMGNSDSQVYILTIYPYEGGYRLYLYTYFRAVTNFLGEMFSSNSSLSTGFVNTIKARDVLLAELPNISIYRQSPEILKQYAYVDDQVIKVIPHASVESKPQIESMLKNGSALKVESSHLKN